jgi:hypothetical protein
MVDRETFAKASEKLEVIEPAKSWDWLSRKMGYQERRTLMILSKNCRFR